MSVGPFCGTRRKEGSRQGRKSAVGLILIQHVFYATFLDYIALVAKIFSVHIEGRACGRLTTTHASSAFGRTPLRNNFVT